MLRNPHVGATEAALELAFSIDEDVAIRPILLGWTDECVSAYYQLEPGDLQKFVAFAADKPDDLKRIANRHRVKYFRINAKELKGPTAHSLVRIDYKDKVQG